MKAKKYPGICKILERELKRKFFSFNDFDDVNKIKYQSNIYHFPIKQYYNQKRRVK
tara:strand:- start:258 stop:425 length:168 start_codon:yes stop_codon:yes gene_type:complete